MGLTRAQVKSIIKTLITDPTNKQNTASRVRSALDYIIDNFTNRVEDLFSTGAGTTGGTGNAYTVTDADEYPTSYTEGKIIILTVDRANTGACTLNVNALGAKSWFNENGTDFGSGDLGVGRIVGVTFDQSLDAFITIYGLGSSISGARNVSVETATSGSIASIPLIFEYNGSANGARTLPAGSADFTGRELTVYNNSTFQFTLNRAGSDTFGSFADSSTAHTVFPGESITITWSGTKWIKL